MNGRLWPIPTRWCRGRLRLCAGAGHGACVSRRWSGERGGDFSIKLVHVGQGLNSDSLMRSPLDLGPCAGKGRQAANLPVDLAWRVSSSRYAPRPCRSWSGIGDALVGLWGRWSVRLAIVERPGDQARAQVAQLVVQALGGVGPDQWQALLTEEPGRCPAPPPSA